MLATGARHCIDVRHLLDSGADPAVLTYADLTALEEAILYGAPQTAALMVRRCPGVLDLPLTYALRKGLVGAVNELAPEARAEDVEQALLHAVGLTGDRTAYLDLLLLRSAALTEQMVERALTERVTHKRDASLLLAWLREKRPSCLPAVALAAIPAGAR